MQGTSRRPNLLVIMSDQHNPHLWGGTGAEPHLPDTPHLNQLAAAGVAFSNTYCPSPLCCPSRMSFLTTRHPSDNEVWTNTCLLDPRRPTWPGALSEAGYETVLCGRMHLYGKNRKDGFGKCIFGDVSDSLDPQGRSTEHIGAFPVATSGQTADSLYPSGGGSSGCMVFDQLVTDRACEFLQNHHQDQDSPFAMVAGLMLPHNPYVAPPELVEKYLQRVDLPMLSDAERASLHPAVARSRRRRRFDFIGEAQARLARASYFAMIERMDQFLGQILETLQSAGLDQDTVVVYTSDHGDMAGEHGFWTKSNFYDGSSGVPMIWRLPNQVEPGRECRHPVSLMDIGTTACDFAGADPVPDSKGCSLRPVLEGREMPGLPDRAIFAEYCGLLGDPPGRMIRKGAYKLNHYDGYARPQLFNMEKDPGENRDLGEDPAFEEIRRKLHREVLEGWSAETIRQAAANSAERRESVLALSEPYPERETLHWVLRAEENRIQQN